LATDMLAGQSRALSIRILA